MPRGSFHKENSCKTGILGVLDAVGAVVFSLACFLMIVCALEVSSKMWQLLLQLNQLQQQLQHKIALQPSHSCSILLCFWVVMLCRLEFWDLASSYKVALSLWSLSSCSFAHYLLDCKTAVFWISIWGRK